MGSVTSARLIICKPALKFSNWKSESRKSGANLLDVPSREKTRFSQMLKASVLVCVCFGSCRASVMRAGSRLIM